MSRRAATTPPRPAAASTATGGGAEATTIPATVPRVRSPARARPGGSSGTAASPAHAGKGRNAALSQPRPAPAACGPAHRQIAAPPEVVRCHRTLPGGGRLAGPLLALPPQGKGRARSSTAAAACRHRAPCRRVPTSWRPEPGEEAGAGPAARAGRWSLVADKPTRNPGGNPLVQVRKGGEAERGERARAHAPPPSTPRSHQKPARRPHNLLAPLSILSPGPDLARLPRACAPTPRPSASAAAACCA